jgi:hypothetical protein
MWWWFPKQIEDSYETVSDDWDVCSVDEQDLIKLFEDHKTEFDPDGLKVRIEFVHDEIRAAFEAPQDRKHFIELIENQRNTIYDY